MPLFALVAHGCMGVLMYLRLWHVGIFVCDKALMVPRYRLYIGTGIPHLVTSLLQCVPCDMHNLHEPKGEDVRPLVLCALLCHGSDAESKE